MDYIAALVMTCRGVFSLHLVLDMLFSVSGNNVMRWEKSVHDGSKACVRTSEILPAVLFNADKFRSLFGDFNP